MTTLLSLLGSFISHAKAATVDQLGAGAPGISGMWDQIRSVFPHTDYGSEGPMLILLKVTEFVLTMIGGAAVAVIVYGGIRMTMYTLDENGIAETKKMVMYALLGVVLALSADVIVFYVQSLVEEAAGA